MKINKVHCFFEQSGTFRDAFRRRGIWAVDYDIENEYGTTNFVIDLFAEINAEYHNERKTVFSTIESEDLIFAFFPCIYFCADNTMFFCGSNRNWANLDKVAMLKEVMQRDEKRHEYYCLLCKLIAVCLRRNLRLIIENPYTQPHYLFNNFPFKPAIIDRNRSVRGDNYSKPTQYFFFNLNPTRGLTTYNPRKPRLIRNQSGHFGSHCGKERSEITATYADNFINDFIFGTPKTNSQLTLF